MMKNTLTFATLTVLLFAGTLHAAVVPAWTVETMDGTVTDSIVRNTGTYALAANFGGSDVTVNSVLFKAGPESPADQMNIAGGGYSISAAASGLFASTPGTGTRYDNATQLKQVISPIAQAGFNGSNIVITFGGLTIGNDYRIQLLVDQVGVARLNNVFFQGAAAPTTSGGNNYGTSNGLSVLLEFEAEAASHALTIFRGSGDRSTMSAVSLFDVTPVLVPSPAALPAGLAMLGLIAARRRR